MNDGQHSPISVNELEYRQCRLQEHKYDCARLNEIPFGWWKLTRTMALWYPGFACHGSSNLKTKHLVLNRSVSWEDTPPSEIELGPHDIVSQD